MTKLDSHTAKIESTLLEGLDPSLTSYDYGDVLSSPIYLKLNKRLPSVARKALRVPEFLFPLFWRRLLKVEKKLIPASLYHMGMYYLIRYKTNQGEQEKEELIKILDKALELSKAYDDFVFWEHTYEHHGIAWKDDQRVNKHGNSCAHHTSRLGLLFYLAGQALNEKRWDTVAFKTANALMQLHHWSYYNDGTAAMSYYPHTTDEVINTSAEASVLLGCFASEGEPFHKAFTGLHNMVLKELTEEGRWAYCTQRHYERYPKEVQFIDCHHTCMNITSLLLNYPRLPEELKPDTAEVINRSLNAFCEDFIREKRLTYFPNQAREATFAGYGEALILFSTVLSHLEVPGLNKDADLFKSYFLKVLNLSTRRFYMKSAKSMASSRNFGKRMDIRSIRFGSGLMLEGLARYCKILKEG